jgi:hypothetical protein
MWHLQLFEGRGSSLSIRGKLTRAKGWGAILRRMGEKGKENGVEKDMGWKLERNTKDAGLTSTSCLARMKLNMKKVKRVGETPALRNGGVAILPDLSLKRLYPTS